MVNNVSKSVKRGGKSVNASVREILESYEKVIFGQKNHLKLMVTALLAGGHVLLEGVPGTGKTKMVNTLAKLIHGEFKRVQFTPDLLPSDIVGSVIFNMKEGQFETLKGPIFTNLFLADEINRTPPKTQAALLEAMEEKQVTIHGQTFDLSDPFFVVATQNPVEFEGTYPLPEAQQDRFLFKLVIDYPDLEAERRLVKAGIHDIEPAQVVKPAIQPETYTALRQQVNEVNVEDAIIAYIVDLVRKTRASDFVQLGASSRAAIALTKASRAWAFIEGRTYVIPDDVKAVIQPVLRHRISLSARMEMEGATSDQVIQDVVGQIPVPR